MLGPDLYNCSQAGLAEFGTYTGATYPLLRNGGSGSGNENLFVPYGQWDSHVVINKQGIMRYNSYLRWPHGNRYHLNEIRACVDSLVSPTVAVGDPPRERAFGLRALPNPSSGHMVVELTRPAAGDPRSRVTVHDLSGRRIATLWEGPAPPGTTRLTWDGRIEGGGPAPAGLYLIRAEVGGVRLGRRVTLLR